MDGLLSTRPTCLVLKSCDLMIADLEKFSSKYNSMLPLKVDI